MLPNYFHAILHRTEKGWDPVPAYHAKRYSDHQWSFGVQDDLIELLDCWIEGIKGKQILALGGGPRQYSIAFSKRGADVTWYDI
jgi:hypothetical protein